MQPVAGMARRTAGTRATPTPPAPASPTVSASRSSVVRYACAHVARPVRWSASGTSRTSTLAELGDQLRQLVEPGRPARDPAPRLGEQRERERVAAAQRGQPCAGRRGHAEAAQQLDALGGGIARQVARPQQPPPARRRPTTPGSGGSRPASTTTASAGSGRQQLARGTSGRAGEQLVGVDQQHRTRAVRPPSRRPPRTAGIDPAEVPAVEADDRRGRGAAARLRISSSSVDLPMPPGPWTNSTRADALPASAAPNDGSSVARPTKPSLRASSRAPDSVSPTPRA